MIDVIVGLQWGDEGKGKIVDAMAPDYDIVARFKGGPNAGHSLEINGVKHVVNTIPSGIFHDKCLNLIGAGVVVDPILLQKEVSRIASAQPNWGDKIIIAKEAKLILPLGRPLDIYFDKMLGLGTTGKAIGPTYALDCLRLGFRIQDISKPDFKDRVVKLTREFQKRYRLKLFESIDNSQFFESTQWLIDNFETVSCSLFVNDALKKGKKVLAEGAQAGLLDLTHGSYPFVTSSSCTVGGVLTGLGVGAHAIGKVIGVFKAYATRVGEGPFPTELQNGDGEKLRELGREYGATTGRPRRTGWLDLLALKYTIDLNGITDLVMTKADVLDNDYFKEIPVCDGYILPDGRVVDEFITDADLLAKVKPHYTTLASWQGVGEATTFRDLPTYFQWYIQYLEEKIGLKISQISNGPAREKILRVA